MDELLRWVLGTSSLNAKTPARSAWFALMRLAMAWLIFRESLLGFFMRAILSKIGLPRINHKESK
ncbi:hypothetical protein HAL07_13630 [Helicobacter ailurogastricus]|uniref:Uncharacterized protein n=1 Tax=Helicobacter ailurogastricus TaxID=1578720 RepID=A0A0K2Y1T4_9HELI|nr:hypothetical protein HAL07_13630 [Helicobacter ailurogastricus]